MKNFKFPAKIKKILELVIAIGAIIGVIFCTTFGFKNPYYYYWIYSLSITVFFFITIPAFKKTVTSKIRVFVSLCIIFTISFLSCLRGMSTFYIVGGLISCCFVIFAGMHINCKKDFFVYFMYVLLFFLSFAIRELCCYGDHEEAYIKAKAELEKKDFIEIYGFSDYYTFDHCTLIVDGKTIIEEKERKILLNDGDQLRSIDYTHDLSCHKDHKIIEIINNPPPE